MPWGPLGLIDDDEARFILFQAQLPSNSDAFSLNSKPSVIRNVPLTRKISITNEESESEEEKRTLMAKIIPFTTSSVGKEKRSDHHDSGKKQRRRVVDKAGEPNIQYKNISKRRRKYISDLYTTLVDSRYGEILGN